MHGFQDSRVIPSGHGGRERPEAGTRSRWRAAVILPVLALLIASGIGLERYVLVDIAFGGQRHDSLEDVEEFDILSDVYDLIREEYILDDEMSDEELIYGAATGMLDSLNDADHSYFMDPETTERHESSMASELVGIGVQVNFDVNPPQIYFPLAGTPAFEAGIRSGDILLSVDGVELATVQDEAERRSILVGDEGSQVTIVLLHQGETEPYEVTITRKRMEINPVSWAMLPGDIMWVRLNGFPDGSAARMTEALEAGNELGANGVILDIRGNSGGWIDEAVAIAGQFQPAGSVVYQEVYEDGFIEPILTEERNGAWQDGPLVVLINDRTLSSGELLSATLKDNDRAILVGVNTFGLGSSVLFYDLPEDTSMALSITLWLTPDGEQMLNEGIAPHVEVRNGLDVFFSLPYLFYDGVLTEDDVTNLDDVQLLVAYDLVLGMVEEAR